MVRTFGRDEVLAVDIDIEHISSLSQENFAELVVEPAVEVTLSEAGAAATGSASVSQGQVYATRILSGKRHAGSGANGWLTDDLTSE